MTLLSPDPDGPPPEYYEYEGFQPGSVLHRISQIDPDGGDVEPTEADYSAFEERVVATYGQQVWDSYRGGRDVEAG